MRDQRPSTFRDHLASLCKARFPCLYIQTWEEERVLGEIRAVAEDVQRIRTPRQVWTWSVTQGFIGPDGTAQRNTNEPLDALRFVADHAGPSVFVLKDFHASFGDDVRPADAAAVRALRDCLPRLRASESPKNIVIVAPVLRLPAELEKDITVVDFALPTAAEIRTVLDGMIEANRHSGRITIDLDDEDKEQLVGAATGLTLLEAENAFARAMVEDGRLDVSDVEVVLEEKRQVIKKTEILEFLRPQETFDDVGGLDNLKRWLLKRNNFWRGTAAEYGLPHPKGLLITGVPGCGKSLTAKCMSSLWGLPLLRLDIGRVFSGLVGSSEENMRNALRTAEAIAPCILWIDEIEKGFGGATGASGDSGTASRVFGSFLTWLQDKQQPVFVMATANNINVLPPEFLRKGRFDEIFFVDLPTHNERRQIFRVHLDRRLRGREHLVADSFDDSVLDALAAASEGYNGAEIEQAIIAGVFDAFAERRAVRLDDVHRAISNTVPLSVTQAEAILAIRQWADIRAVAATAADDREHYALAGDELPPDDSGAVTAGRGGREIDF